LTAFLFAACCETAGAATPVFNEPIPLGTLGGSFDGDASAVNESGTVVGISTIGDVITPFRWTAANGMDSLGSLGGPGQALAVNDRGHVAGMCRTSPAAFDRAFLWTPSTGIVQLGSLSNESSDARGINNFEQVAGSTSTIDLVQHAFLWSSDKGMQDLGTLDSAGVHVTRSGATAVSDAGHVAGYSQTAAGSAYHAFLWTAATGMKDLGTLGGSRSLGFAVNNLGHVAGVSDDAMGRERAFLWTPERGMEDLGTLPGGTTSEALGLNDQDQVVGQTTPNGRPFFWTRGTGMIELPTHGTGSGEAAAINDRGQIVGRSSAPSGLSQPVLWTQTGTTFVVTKTADTNDGSCNADCSLREAIVSANATSSPDVIALSAGTYALSLAGAGEDAGATGDLDITDSLTINGAGTVKTIIDGGALDRVFHIHAGSSVLIRDLTIRNGRVLDANGGGICNEQGFLTLVNCSVADNVADGDDAPTVEANVRGGGLYTDGGTLTIDSCTFSGNQARGTIGSAIGGGMSVNSGLVSVRNSTISGNSASTGRSAGTPYADARGGGIFQAGAMMNVQNCTIASNSAAVLKEAPFTSIGGGIENQSGSGALKLTGTIVAGNHAAIGPDCSGLYYGSGGYNLIGQFGAPCGLQTGIMTGNLLNVDAKLGPLQDNGGPTLTHELLTGSPAINAMPPALCPATDQRGALRPQDTACEIGAFEVAAPRRHAVPH